MEKNILKEESEREQSVQTSMDQTTFEAVEELFQMARTGETARLKNLFEMGFKNANIRDAKGNSLLMIAAYNGQHETVRLLLENGGDPEIANDQGQTPLAGIAFKGDVEMARILIENGADVNGRSPDGKTALMFAAMFNRVEIIELFLANGADADLQTTDGATARSLARVMNADAAAARLSQN